MLAHHLTEGQTFGKPEARAARGHVADGFTISENRVARQGIGVAALDDEAGEAPGYLRLSLAQACVAADEVGLIAANEPVETGIDESVLGADVGTPCVRTWS